VVERVAHKSGLLLTTAILNSPNPTPSIERCEYRRLSDRK
jgi:hypothetical protein